MYWNGDEGNIKEKKSGGASGIDAFNMSLAMQKKVIKKRSGGETK